MSARLSPRQRQVIAYMERLGGTVTADLFNDVLSGQPKSILAMFRNGWVEGDAVPARNITLTQAARDAAAAFDKVGS